MDRAACIKKIGRYIRDEGTLAFLFDGRFDKDDFLTTVGEIYKSYSAVFNLAFALIYSRYRRWRAENPDLNPDKLEKFNSYMRITKTFSGLFRERALGFAIIEPTILDVQLDIYYDGIISKDMGMSEYFNRDADNRFAYFIRCAELARRSSRMIDMKEDITVKYDELVELLSLFPFLQDLTLTVTPLLGGRHGTPYLYEGGERYEFDGVCRVTMELDGLHTQEALDTCLTLLAVDGRFYYLQNVLYDTTDGKTKDVLRLAYSGIGIEDCEFYLAVTTQEGFVGKDGELGLVGPKAVSAVSRDLRLNVGTENEGALLRDFYSINYRYIKQLALSVSDVLTDEVKHRLHAQYSSKHPTLFEGGSWDSAVVVLLVKESATGVLQFLFSCFPSLFGKLLHSLESRFGSDVFLAEKLREEIEREAASAYERWSAQYFGESQTANDVVGAVAEEERSAILSEVRALQIVSYLSELVTADETQDGSFKNKYPLNINSHIKMLELLQGSGDLPLSRRREKVRSIVFRTLKSLYIFYCGFFRYVRVKSEYHAHSRDSVMTAKQIDEFQSRANREFRAEVKAQGKRLSALEGNDVGAILAELSALNDECIYAADNAAKEKKRLLGECLGRYQLLDFSEVKPLEMLTELGDVDDQGLDARIGAILEIYRYLQNGKEEGAGLEGIYPYVGTFEYAQETRDGYRIAHFSVASPAAKRDLDIEMISDFRYTINTKYYCMPNQMCSNNGLKLWIEPTLIAYGNLEMIDEDT